MSEYSDGGVERDDDETSYIYAPPEWDVAAQVVDEIADITTELFGAWVGPLWPIPAGVYELDEMERVALERERECEPLFVRAIALAELLAAMPLDEPNLSWSIEESLKMLRRMIWHTSRGYAIRTAAESQRLAQLYSLLRTHPSAAAGRTTDVP